jgi:6-phosphogluconolactonase (cycloisomerase 2 family)
MSHQGGARRSRRVTLLATVLVAGFASTASAEIGDMTQSPSQGACLREGAATDCLAGRALAGVGGVAVSADNRFAYVPAAVTNSVSVLGISPAGELSQDPGVPGCAANNGGIPCVDVGNLGGASSVVISPDDLHVYASGFNGLSAFSRDAATGQLNPLPGATNCYSDTDFDSEAVDNQCVNVRAASSVRDLAINPAGTVLYAAVNVPGSGFDGVAILQRDPQTGALSQGDGAAGCFTQGGDATGDGDGSGGLILGCGGPGRALANPTSLAVSPNGATLYVGTPTSVATLAIGPGGTLTQPAGTAGCIEFDVTEGCTDGRAIANVSSIAVSPDSGSVYVGSGAPAIAHLRAAADGTLSQAPGESGCVAETAVVADGPGLTCSVVRALGSGTALTVAVAPDGLSVLAGSADPVQQLASFDRTADGALTQDSATSSCFSIDASASGAAGGPGRCALGRGLAGSGFAFADNGARVLSAGPTGVGVFAREAPVAAPLPSLKSTKLKPKRKKLKVTLLCAASAPTTCAGDLAVTTKGKVKTKPNSRKKKQLKILNAPYSIQPGASATLKQKASKKVLGALAIKKKIKGTATLTAAPSSAAFTPNSASVDVTLKRGKKTR